MSRIQIFEGAGGSSLLTGLNHYWDLDGGTGWVDDVGGWTLSETGTVTDSATGGPDGGSAASFSGTGDYLSKATASWDGAQDNLTLSMWIYNTSTPGSVGNYWMSFRDGTDNFSTIFSSTSSSDAAKGVVWDDAGAASVPVGAVISLNTWYHIVLTDDGTTRKLYLNNGTPTTDTTALSGTYDPDPMVFAIGTTANNLGNNAYQHVGRLCMGGIWDIAITADQVSQLYNSGNGLRHSALT